MPESTDIGGLIFDWGQADLNAKRKERLAEKARACTEKIAQKLRAKMQEEIDRCVSIYHQTYPESIRFGGISLVSSFNPNCSSARIRVHHVDVFRDSPFYDKIATHGNYYRHPDGERLLAILEENLSWKYAGSFQLLMNSLCFHSEE